MLLEAAVCLNDVHLELEDDDHVCSCCHCHSPSQLQGRDEEVEDDQVEGPEL